MAEGSHPSLYSLCVMMRNWLLEQQMNVCLPRLLILFPLLALANVAAADAIPTGTAYMLTDHFGGGWSDAEKSPATAEDDNLCWAAAASNVLAWGGWGTAAGFDSSDQIFQYLADHWSNQGSMANAAWTWWFNGTNPYGGKAAYAQLEVAGGGFFPDEPIAADYSYSNNGHLSLSSIDHYLHLGMGIALVLDTDSGGGHEITCWGINTDPTNPDKYVGIWVTDSDDDKTNPSPPDRLRYYEVRQGAMAWYLEDFYGTNDTWSIDRVEALAPLPEPTTVLLLPAGAVAILRRSRGPG